MNGYIVCSRGKYRFIDESKVFINRNTPVGESADFYERMPYNGKRMFEPLFKIRDNVCVSAYGHRYNYELNRWEVEISPKLAEYFEVKTIRLPERLNDRTFTIYKN